MDFIFWAMFSLLALYTSESTSLEGQFANEHHDIRENIPEGRQIEELAADDPFDGPITPTQHQHESLTIRLNIDISADAILAILQNIQDSRPSADTKETPMTTGTQNKSSLHGRHSTRDNAHETSKRLKTPTLSDEEHAGTSSRDLVAENSFQNIEAAQPNILYGAVVETVTQFAYLPTTLPSSQNPVANTMISSTTIQPVQNAPEIEIALPNVLSPPIPSSNNNTGLLWQTNNLFSETPQPLQSIFPSALEPSNSSTLFGFYDTSATTATNLTATVATDMPGLSPLKPPSQGQSVGSAHAMLGQFPIMPENVPIPTKLPTVASEPIAVPALCLPVKADSIRMLVPMSQSMFYSETSQTQHKFKMLSDSLHDDMKLNPALRAALDSIELTERQFVALLIKIRESGLGDRLKLVLPQT